MNGPRIGDLSPEWHAGRCSYAEDERSVACLRDAAWHGIAADYRGMESCDLHKPIMDVLVRWTHPLEPACSLPEARFHEDVNECRVPWDQVQMPAAESVAAVRGDQP